MADCQESQQVQAGSGSGEKPLQRGDLVLTGSEEFGSRQHESRGFSSRGDSPPLRCCGSVSADPLIEVFRGSRCRCL